jgi:hypothetical protein
MRDKKGNLRRKLIEMPADVKLALEQTGFCEYFDHRWALPPSKLEVQIQRGKLFPRGRL